MHRSRASQLLAVFSLSCRSEGSGHDLEASLPGKRGLVGIQKGDEMAIVSPGQNFRADRLGRAGKFKMVVAGCFGQLPDFFRQRLSGGLVCQTGQVKRRGSGVCNVQRTHNAGTNLEILDRRPPFVVVDAL